ncbi:MAG: hypothetical protein AB1445_07855 [Bacillota bacterium]
MPTLIYNWRVVGALTRKKLLLMWAYRVERVTWFFTPVLFLVP